MRLLRLASLLLVAAPASAQTDTYMLPLGGAAEVGAGWTTATTRGAGALLSTPAAVAGTPREVTVTVMRWSDALTQGRLSAVFPLGQRLPLNLSVGVVAGGFVRSADAAGGAATASRGEFIGGATLGAGVGAVRAGVGVKGLLASYDDAAGGRTSATGVTVDAGVQAHFAGEALVVGLALRHFGPATSGQFEVEPPAEIHVGVAWQALTLRPSDSGVPLARVRLVGDVQQGATRARTLNTAVEVVGFDRFTGRLGYVKPLDDGDANAEIDPRWTFGLGYAQDAWRADVAVLPSPIGNEAALLLTLGTRF